MRRFIARGTLFYDNQLVSFRCLAAAVTAYLHPVEINTGMKTTAVVLYKIPIHGFRLCLP